MIVAYATQAGRTADDGSGRNSPFTAAFLRHIEAQEEIGTIFRRISADVYEATKRMQLPELSLSLIGEFYLRGRVDISVAPSIAPTPAPRPDPCAAAADHWRSTEAIGTIAAFEDHLARFPTCTFAGLAKARIAAAVPPTQPAPPPAPVGPAVGIFPPASGASPLTAERERALKPKDTFKECEGCPEMVVVPAGSFIMGSPVGEQLRGLNEGPQHRVTIAKPFAVAKFHVTRDQFATFVDETGFAPETSCWIFENPNSLVHRKDRSWRNPGFAQDGTHPAVCLSWDDAKRYVAWLSAKTGKNYRLLTEAEWEYAARAGSTTQYSYGNDAKDICRYGNGLDQTGKREIAGYPSWMTFSCSDGYAYTSPVGSFAPNAFGLYDMHGNAWQRGGGLLSRQLSRSATGRLGLEF